MTELPNLDTLTHEQTLDMVAAALRDPNVREAVCESTGHAIAVLRAVERMDLQGSVMAEECDRALREHRDAVAEIARIADDKRRVMAHCAELASKLEQAETQSRKDGYEIAGLRMRVEMHERIASGALQCCGSIPRRITLDDVATAVGERLATDLVLEREMHAKTQAQLEMALLRLTEKSDRVRAEVTRFIDAAPDRDVVDEFDLGQDQPTPAVPQSTMEETMRMRKP